MIGKLVIGEGITEIGTSLFDNDEARALNAVREIVFPESLVTIGDYAFSGCGMESLTFSSFLQHIGEGSFLGCQHLTSVSFTGSGAEIGPMAFFQCSNLQTLNIDGVSKIDKYAFQECDAIKTLTLKNVETIGEGAFFWCQGLETLTLENVGLVDEYAFQKCISLETVSLKNVETISMCAFFQCGGLETLTLENVGLVDEYAFQQCTSLETVSMENVETVGQDAFFQCYELKHADLTNVGTLMGFVFEQTALESATMNQVGTINRNAFYECSSLTNVTGLDTVERIDGFAFFGCSSLKGLTVADATNQNGEAMPNKNITRAEFATIVARFLGTTQVDPDLNFTDIKGHWAEQDILRAASANWMQGYSSKFRPNDYITRAEVATTINRMTGRRPKKDVEMEGMIHWPDNADPAAWYYEAIQEATNDHDYEREDVSDVEEWTEITHDVDWLALEKLWIAYNGATGPKD